MTDPNKLSIVIGAISALVSVLSLFFAAISIYARTIKPLRQKRKEKMMQLEKWNKEFEVEGKKVPF